MKQIKVVVKNVGERPKEQFIEDKLEAMQIIVEGYIEAVMITKDIVLVINEEGKINNLDNNFGVATFELKGDVYESQLHDVIFGNGFFVASKGSRFTSLSEEQIDFIMKGFNLDGTMFVIDRKEAGI